MRRGARRTDANITESLFSSRKENQVQYMILIYGNENEFAQLADQATKERMYAAFNKTRLTSGLRALLAPAAN